MMDDNKKVGLTLPMVMYDWLYEYMKDSAYNYMANVCIHFMVVGMRKEGFRWQ